MINLEIRLENRDRIMKALKKFPRESASEFNKAIEKSVIKVQRDAMKNAPVNKGTGGGNLRQSIKRKVSRLEGSVLSQVEYAIYVHEGTRPHTITVKRKKVLADRRKGRFFGKRVHHPGTKPRPFLANAVKENKKKIEGYFIKAMKNVTNMIK